MLVYIHESNLNVSLVLFINSSPHSHPWPDRLKKFKME